MKVNIKIDGLEDFLEILDRFQGDHARRQLQLFLEKSGFDFLDTVQDQIIAQQVVDTRRMLNSFDKGGDGNIWKLDEGGLKLIVGTNVTYAQWVNDGHWTTPEGVDRRWVPGSWSGDSFEYQKGAKTGMLLKRKWVEGRPYWDNAVTVYEKMFGDNFQRLVRNWIEAMKKG